MFEMTKEGNKRNITGEHRQKEGKCDGNVKGDI